MAQLPTLTHQLVPNYSAGVPPEASIEGAGAGGEAITRAGYTLGQVAGQIADRHYELQRQANATRASDQALDFRAAKRQYLLDPQGGALLTEGRDAMGVYKKGEAALEEMAQTFEDQLDNNQQKAIFRASIGVDLESSLNQLAEHEAKAIGDYRSATSKAVVNQQIEDAIGTADDPRKQDAHLATLEDMIRLNVDHLPPAAVDFQVKEAVSKVHSGAVAALAYRNPDAAMAYLNAHASEVQGSDRLALEQHIDAGLRRRIAEQDHAMAVSERSQRKLAQERAKEGDALLHDNKLTPEWVHAHAPELDENDVRYFLNQIDHPDRPEVRDDPNVLADLWDRQDRGEDIHDPARQAVHDGKLSGSSYRVLQPHDREASNEEKRSIDLINGLVGGGGEFAGPERQAGAAIARTAWWQWREAHPQATEKEMLDQARILADHQRLIDSNSMIYTLDMPRTLVRRPPSDEGGIASTYDIEATLREFDRRQQAGEFTPEEAAAESQRILNLEKAIGWQPPPPPAPPPPPKSSTAVPGVPGARYGGAGTTVYGAIPPPALVAPEGR